MGSKLADELLQPATKKLIVKAIEANPRQLKRFVNNIILAKSVFFSNELDENIEIDKLVAVQALNFRPEWNTFLQLITPNPIRKLFFVYYYLPLSHVGKVFNSEEALDNLKKEKDNDKKSLPDMIIDIFQELVKQENDSLRSFLEAGADMILEDIDEMQKYRRALETTKFKEGEKQLKEGEKQWSGKSEPFNKLLLQLLSAGEVHAFNEMRLMYDKFLPNLSNSNLLNANLSWANLLNANLLNADLSNSKLSNAKLVEANLVEADLSNSKLFYADLLNADLLNADLSLANLSDANLRHSLMIGTRYQDQGEYFKCLDTDLVDSIIDDENLSIALKDGNAKNVPPAVENKSELRKRLIKWLEVNRSPIDDIDVEFLLSLSPLRD